MKHELVIYPNPILKKECEKVSFPLSKEDRELLDEMYDFVKDPKNEAVGLAAPQFGVSKCMFVIRHKDTNGKVDFQVKMVNPTVLPDAGARKTYCVQGGEGCLSEPGKRVAVNRYNKVMLMGYDAITNRFVKYKLTGFLAAAVQHEQDHLRGKLLVDYETK